MPQVGFIRYVLTTVAIKFSGCFGPPKYNLSQSTGTTQLHVTIYFLNYIEPQSSE